MSPGWTMGAEAPAMRGGARGAPGRRSARCRWTTRAGYRPTWPAGSTPGRGERGGQTQPNGRIQHQYRTPHVKGQGPARRRSDPAVRDLGGLSFIVRTVRAATEHEVVVAFLRAEIDSERHDQRSLNELHAEGRPRSVVDAPELRDPEANV